MYLLWALVAFVFGLASAFLTLFTPLHQPLVLVVAALGYMVCASLYLVERRR